MENHMYTDQQEANALKTIENQTFDMERALYGSRDVEVKNCRFDGPADGESAFKECDNVRADHCFFNLRYPFWHDHGLRITDSADRSEEHTSELQSRFDLVCLLLLAQ